jgi:UDP-galactopyranose mutase
LPVNRQTVNTVFGVALQTEDAVRTFLAGMAVPCDVPANAADYLNARVGRTITDLFFRPYTKKMWGHDLEDMDAAVVKRIPIRYDLEDRYFPTDQFQVMPRGGYTTFFEHLLDHRNIRVHLATPYSPGMGRDYVHVFNSMPIDEYFGFDLGELPYRSIRFHHKGVRAWRDSLCPVVNYTDSGPFTRETTWHLLPGHAVRDTGLRSVTVEEPCDYRDNGHERYYPIKTADDRFGRLYQAYRARGDALCDMSFIGRCGTYQYLDMHQVINQSLAGAAAWLASSGAA